jgi:intracellular sulfur oxidation DsrE/DsrF family protein
MAMQANRRGLVLGILAAAMLLGGCAGMGMGQKTERVVIQVSDGDPKVWNLALNVVGNVKASYAKRGMQPEIEVVAFGPGIQMLKDDSVVATRMRDAMKGGAQMVACENSMDRFKLKREVMLDKVSYVDAGVIHIIERQHQGWAVIRP